MHAVCDAMSVAADSKLALAIFIDMQNQCQEIIAVIRGQK
jgi:hypothetical protein